MQNLLLNNMTLADEFLKTAYGLCKTDPLLLNEMGVVFYHQEHLEEAVTMFISALEIASEIDSDSTAWIPTRANLGHAYRRLGRWDDALCEFDDVLRQGGRDPQVFCAKALVLMELRRPADAVVVLHEALAIVPQDAIATELLNKALDETVDGGLEFGNEEEEECERELALRKMEAAIVYSGKRADRKGKGRSAEPHAPKFRARFSSGIGTEGNSLMELSSDD
jgi:anaphase-promoting complex subunit 6